MPGIIFHRAHLGRRAECIAHPTPPLVGSSDTELLLPTEALLYVAARRDYATDLAAELLFQRRPPGHELKPRAIVDHCEAAGRGRDPLALSPGHALLDIAWVARIRLKPAASSERRRGW